MPPNDGNFFHLESQLAREEQDFGVDPPALNFLQWKDRERCRAFECFESTLRVFEMQAEREAQQQIEDSTKDLTVYWLALGLISARSQRDPIAISVFSSSALRSLDDSSIGEDRSASLKMRTSPLLLSIPLRTL